MQNYLNKLSTSPLSKLLIYTKYGGVPFLNDYLISLFEGVESFNVLFPELLTNMDCFKKFHSEKIAYGSNPNQAEDETRLLSKFFHLNKTYLSFMDYNDDNSDNGINAENYLIVNSSNGKSKVSIQDYLKFLEILNPNVAVMPFEFIPKDSGNKRVVRSYTKVLEFLKLYNLNYENQNKEKNKGLVLPVHLNSMEKIPFKELNKYKQLIDGYLLISENYSQLSFNKMLKIKEDIADKLDSSVAKIKYGEGHPIEIMISREIGCEYLEVSYPFNVSETGLCIVSDFLIDYNALASSEGINELKAYENLNFDLKKIDLSEKVYEMDNSIIKEGCNCFTCTKGYSRAYIHHLIKCNELNGKILVIMHNLYFVCEFYKNYNSISEEEKRLAYFAEFIKNQCVTKAQYELVKDEKKNNKRDFPNKNKNENGNNIDD